MPKLVLPSFWMIWGHFGNFLNFSFCWNFSEFLGPKNGRKKISLKWSFFSAQNWFYPISERFGAFLAIFQIFHFLKFFRVFWSEKWAKKILEKCHFLVPKIGFTQFLNDVGHFRHFFKLFTFFEIFSSFLVWKMGEKKFLEKCHFLVPKIGFTQFLNVLGHFWQFFKFFIFSRNFPDFFWSEKWAKKNFSKNVIF